MKVKHIFIFLNKETLQSNATIDVPGIGEVKIDHSLSDDLIERIREESVAALRLRLGQTLAAVPPVPTSGDQHG